MTMLQFFMMICITCFTSYSCNENSNGKLNINSNDTLLLRILFTPAFHEHSETLLLKNDSLQIIQILIKNDFRADKSQDTFLYKRLFLTGQQYLSLDSTLIKECKKKTINKQSTVLDGMGISSLCVNKGDTNIIYFHSPSMNQDSIGYHFSKSLMDILNNTFQDSLVNEYFDDIEAYIDESKFRRADPKRKIDQLRMKKYNWTISNPN